MRNLLLIVAVLAGIYFYQRATPPPLPPPPVVVRAVPASRPKLYFHSALDAPAMSTGASTGTGYYSTSADSHFGPGSRLGAGSSNGPQR